MNDPGLEGPIDDVGEQVRDNVHHMQESEVADGMEEEEQERNYLLPARWWYASTGIPLIAGTFGPIANAFSVCALVEDWRVKIPPNGTEEHGIPIKDPKWCVAICFEECALIRGPSG
jgi:potassium channel subfamily K